MAERDEHIQDKEKKVYDLKKRNQELEKFKFVLDFRIKELKEQVEPRENEIADMTTEINVRQSIAHLPLVHNLTHKIGNQYGIGQTIERKAAARRKYRRLEEGPWSQEAAI